MVCFLWISSERVNFFILCLEIEIKSDATLADAVKILAGHNVFSAPVVDVEAPEDASWIDRYIGIVEFAGIVVWILHQVRYVYHICFILIQFNYSYWGSDSLHHPSREKKGGWGGAHMNLLTLKLTITFVFFALFNSKYVELNLGLQLCLI